MQISNSKLNTGPEHQYKSLCHTCKHYEFGVGFFVKSTKDAFAEHICNADCAECIPGDCVIRCSMWEKRTERKL